MTPKQLSSIVTDASTSPQNGMTLLCVPSSTHSKDMPFWGDVLEYITPKWHDLTVRAVKHAPFIQSSCSAWQTSLSEAAAGWKLRVWCTALLLTIAFAAQVWLTLTMSVILLLPALLVSFWFAGLYPASPYGGRVVT